jgi:hypothetical protein
MIKKISKLAELMPGTTFIEVEAFGNGRWFQINPPLVVVEEPSYKAIEWARGSKYSVWVRKLGDADKAQNTFSVSVPSEDGVNIVRDAEDYSEFYVYTPSTEQELGGLRSLGDYHMFKHFAESA